MLHGIEEGATRPTAAPRTACRESRGGRSEHVGRSADRRQRGQDVLVVPTRLHRGARGTTRARIRGAASVPRQRPRPLRGLEEDSKQPPRGGGRGRSRGWRRRRDAQRRLASRQQLVSRGQCRSSAARGAEREQSGLNERRCSSERDTSIARAKHAPLSNAAAAAAGVTSSPSSKGSKTRLSSAL